MKLTYPRLYFVIGALIAGSWTFSAQAAGPRNTPGNDPQNCRQNCPLSQSTAFFTAEPGNDQLLAGPKTDEQQPPRRADRPRPRRDGARDVDRPNRPRDDTRGADRPRDGRGRGDRRPDGQGLMRALHQLDLSDDQKAQLKTIHEQNRAVLDKWREENKESLDAARNAMREAREQRDREAAQAARGDLQKLMAAAPARGQVRDQVMAVLTDEQKKKLRELMGNQRRRAPREGDGGQADGPHRRRGPQREGDDKPRPRRPRDDDRPRRGDQSKRIDA